MKPGEPLSHLLEGKKLLIFDFDGTVADTTPLHAEAFAEVLAPLGISVDYSSIAGLKTLDAMHKLLDKAGVKLSEFDVHALVVAKQAFVRGLISEKLEPIPGVDEFLRWAKPKFHLSMVTSGSSGTVQLALEKLGYLNWFEPLVCAEDVCNAKPDPEGFLSALSLTAIPAEQALIFEDSEAGFLAARNAEIEFIEVTNYYFTDLLKGK
jgi:HAD superfamily hydrolase (TIGR01509 family)